MIDYGASISELNKKFIHDDVCARPCVAGLVFDLGIASCIRAGIFNAIIRFQRIDFIYIGA